MDGPANTQEVLHVQVEHVTDLVPVPVGPSPRPGCRGRVASAWLGRAGVPAWRAACPVITHCELLFDIPKVVIALAVASGGPQRGPLNGIVLIIMIFIHSLCIFFFF